MIPEGRIVAIGRAAVLGAGLLLWELLGRVFGNSTIPGPMTVGLRLAEQAARGEILEHAATTLGEAGGGLLVGVLAGIGAALLVHRSHRLEEALAPLLTGIMGFPKLALAPVITLWFGIGLASKIAFVAFAVFFLVFFSMQSGLRAVDPTLLAMARLMGAGRRAIVWHVLIPSTLPFLFGTLKLVVPHAITIAVVAELIVSRAGLGFYIKLCAAQADTVGIFVGVTVVMLIVAGVSALLQRAEDRWLAWRQ